MRAMLDIQLAILVILCLGSFDKAKAFDKEFWALKSVPARLRFLNHKVFVFFAFKSLSSFYLFTRPNKNFLSSSHKLSYAYTSTW